MVETYKIINKIDIVNIDTMCTPKGHTRTREHGKKPFRPNITKNVFSNRIIEVWNDLPEHVVNSGNINIFKHRLNNHWKNHVRKFLPST